LVKVTAAAAVEICSHMDLQPDARKLLRDGMKPREFIDALLAKKQYIAGIEFVAHTLPPREGIWWGCLCLQHACGSALTPQDRAAAVAAVQWVLQPGDKTRAAAKFQGEAAGPASVAGHLAMGAYQAGPGIASPGGPAIPIPPFATAKSVANAVKLACTKSDPAKIIETQKLFVELGITVAEGRLI